MLWSTQGITSTAGRRTVPSAGAAGSLNLGTVLVGAFDDREVKRVLQLMPLGRL